MRNNIYAHIIIASAILFAAACGSDYKIEKFDYKAEYDRVSKTAAQQTKNEGDKDVADILKRKSSYMYSAVGKRDPFRTYFGDFKALEKERKIVHELQKYDISDLRLSAIVWGITEPRAVILSPDKKSYIVKRGSFLGKNWGKISNILPDKIEIIETYKDPLGRKILNKLYLELPIKSLISSDDREVLEDSGKSNVKRESTIVNEPPAEDGKPGTKEKD